MLKRALVIMFITCSVMIPSLHSQSRFGFGAYLGSSITDLSGMDGFGSTISDELTAAAGKEFPVSTVRRTYILDAGGYVSYRLTNRLSLQAGMEYAPRGVAFEGELYLSSNQFAFTSEVMTLYSDLKLNFIELPVSVQFSTRKNQTSNKPYFFGNIGISPAYLMNARLDIMMRVLVRDLNYIPVRETIKEEESNSTEISGIKATDLGLFLSLGVGFNNLFCDVKFTQGIADLQVVDVPNHNQMLTIRLGINFNQKQAKN